MTLIMGKSQATAYQMSTYLLSNNISPRFSRSISALDFCQLYLTIADKECVRGDIAFAQACKETGNFKFTGDVNYMQNNFAGIGATGGVPGFKFDTIEEGILAHVQHLKSYATKEPLNCKNVDPRRTDWFMKAKGGTSPDVETLSGTWAVPGYDTKKYSSLAQANAAKDSYGHNIVDRLNEILKVGGKENKTMKIAIDAGHGSNTAGKRSPAPDSYREHWANVKVASYFAKAMDRCGVPYIKTGWNDDNSKDDADTALSTRQSQIKNAKCDYSISFHFNASGDGATFNSGEGIETLIHNSYPADSKRLAECIQKYLIKGTVQKNRGVKTQALSMCNCKIMNTKASVLIECGFMTNKKELELMKSDAFCKECAEEAAHGFCEYAGIKYVAENVTAQPTPVVQKQQTVSSSFVVKCKDDLNIRKTPNGEIVIKNGCKKTFSYTIVEMSGNWGKLKSGLGWICISDKYVTRI